jgi:hypothetical protein
VRGLLIYTYASVALMAFSSEGFFRQHGTLVMVSYEEPEPKSNCGIRVHDIPERIIRYLPRSSNCCAMVALDMIVPVNIYQYQPVVLDWMVASMILTMSSSETSFSLGGMIPFARRTSFHSVSALGSLNHKIEHQF